MRNRAVPILGALLSTTVVTAVRAAEPAVPMKNAYQALLNLQVMAATPEKFGAAEHREWIETDLKTLAAARHAFGKGDRKIDPGLAATLAAFGDYVQEARDEFRKGSTEYTRQMVRGTGGFCLSCHARVPSPEDFQDASGRVETLKISTLKKAELFAASRQFDRALAAYRSILESKPQTAMDAVELGRALRHYVILLVRVKQDDELLASTLKKLSKRADLPEFLQSLASSLRDDAEFWRKDRVESRDLTASALLRHGRRLVERGESLRASSTLAGGEISFLRATGYLHEALAKGVADKERGETLYLLGSGYAALEDPSFAALDQAFFEACIRENPRTPFARKCFRKYLHGLVLDPERATEARRKKVNELRELIQ